MSDIIALQSTPVRQSRLLWLLGEIDRSKLQAQLLIAQATTGACNLRKVYQADRELTPQEKAEDCLQAAQRHIHRLDILVENATKVIEGVPLDQLRNS